MLNNIIIFLSIAFTTFIFGKCYIFLWSKIKELNTTPSGFGVILPLILIIISIIKSDLFIFPISSVFIIFLAGLIYLIDDFKGLHHWIRISIAFIFGALLFFVEVQNVSFSNVIIICLVILFGVISVGLTNMMNFYDGADLNIASIILLAGIILFYYPGIDGQTYKNIGIVFCSFSIGFGVFNRKPNSLYLGDAGSFVMALFFLYFLISFFISKNVPVELITVLALPLFDVFYVMLIRLYYKHDMLSRNYLHLYQRIDILYGGFFHIVPQLSNVLAIISLSRLINIFLMDKTYSLLLAGFIFTPIFYLICRYLFIERSYFFGDGK